MSFKSKQRMKHSHLFGDDPLNASSTSIASDDPLFGSSATGRSSGRATPTDPLSARNSRPSSPSSLFETSSAASGSPRLNAKRMTNGASSHSGSIFGDIDVSKLGGNGIFNGKKSASLRASASSSLRNVGDDDEVALFGGGGSGLSPGRSGNKGVSAAAAAAAARPSISSASSTSTRSSASDIERKPVQPTPPPVAPRKPAPPPPPPTASTSSTLDLRRENEPASASNAEPQVQSNRSTGTSSLFSRFIKSKPSTPTGSGQASPIDRQHQNSSAPAETTTTASARAPTTKRTSTKAPPPPVPPRQPPAADSALQQKLEPRNPLAKVAAAEERQKEEEKEDDEEEPPENIPAVVIEDEATRAFAEDVHFDTPSYKLPSTYDDPEILASVTNDALRLDDRPPMTPSISTPAGMYASHHQQTRPSVNDIMFSEPLNPWSSLGPSIDPLFTRTASTSSPLLKNNEQKVKLSEIDPCKRSAFADLIESWNGNKHQQRSVRRDRPDDDDETFFSKVAEEQRDIGFAGLDGNDQVPTNSTHRFERDTRNWNIVDNDNPWR